MICISLLMFTPLMEFLLASFGGLGILALAAELCDDYARDLPPTVQQGKTKGDR